MGSLEFLILSGIAFFASILQGIAGIGFGMLFIPLGLLFLPPTYVIPLAMSAGFLVNCYLWVHYHKYVNLKRIWPLFLGSFITIPIGAYILYLAPSNSIRLMVGVLIGSFAVLMALGISFHVKRERVGFFVSGLISGVLASGFGMGGPPLALFLTNQQVQKYEFKGIFSLYVVYLIIVIMGYFIYLDLLTKTIVKESFYLVPILFFGTQIGIWISTKVNQGFFRTLTLSIILTSAVLIFVRVLIFRS